GIATCHGRTTCGWTAAEAGEELYEAAADCLPRNAEIELPFEPGEVADNLRLERYTQRWSKSWAIGIYYRVRPLLPVALRRLLQLSYHRGWKNLSFPDWPVDRSVDSFFTRLMALRLRHGPAEIPFVWFWPQGCNGCVIVTHDVETSRGRDFTARLMEVDQSFGFRSLVLVVPEARYEVPESFLAGIRERGFEVGVHGLNHDGRLFEDRHEFLRRARLINQYGQRFGARGFRSPVMYRNPDWMEALDFDYDLSMPNVAHLDPQRGGCCTVMPYFIGRLVELPLTTVQDYALFHLLKDYSTDLWKQQIGAILDSHGLVTVLSHPDYLRSERPMSVYKGLLEHLRSLGEERRLWFALPGQVERWWRQRSRMRLTPAAAGWRIEGKGSERACLAVAALDGDRVVYELQPHTEAPAASAGG
ncbi:MAG: hypothetical protein V3T83_07895, partial [Acidobacteriota bacterium]